MAKVKQLTVVQLLGRMSNLFQSQNLVNVVPALMSALVQIVELALPHPTMVQYLTVNLRLILTKLEKATDSDVRGVTDKIAILDEANMPATEYSAPDLTNRTGKNWTML